MNEQKLIQVFDLLKITSKIIHMIDDSFEEHFTELMEIIETHATIIIKTIK